MATLQSIQNSNQYFGSPLEYCPQCWRSGRGYVLFVPAMISHDKVMWLCRNWKRCPFPHIDGDEMVKRVTVPRNSVDPKLLGYISPDDDHQYQLPVALDNQSEEKLILDLTSFTSAQRRPPPPFDPNQGDQFIFPNFGASSDNDETISSTSTNALSTTHTGGAPVMTPNQTAGFNPNQQNESLVNVKTDTALSTSVHPPAVEINRRDYNRERLLQEKMKEKKLTPISTPAIVSRKRPLVKTTQNEKPPAFPGYEVDGNKAATSSTNTNTTPATPAGSTLLGSNSPANVALISLLTKQLKKVRKGSL